METLRFIYVNYSWCTCFEGSSRRRVTGRRLGEADMLRIEKAKP